MNITKEELKTHGYLAAKEEPNENYIERIRLEIATSVFLARGGKVIEVPAGAVADDGLLGRGRAQKEQEDAARIKAAKVSINNRRSKGRLNIQVKRGKFEVVVHKVYIGVFDSEQEAVDARDKYRNNLGYSVAQY